MIDIVVTTISPPTIGTKLISSELNSAVERFGVVGDRKGPLSYDLPNTRFYDIETQTQLPFHSFVLLSEGHYARKNAGIFWRSRRRHLPWSRPTTTTSRKRAFGYLRLPVDHNQWTSNTADGSRLSGILGWSDLPRGFPLDRNPAFFAGA